MPVRVFFLLLSGDWNTFLKYGNSLADSVRMQYPCKLKAVNSAGSVKNLVEQRQ
jgi:hypothetical protein